MTPVPTPRPAPAERDEPGLVTELLEALVRAADFISKDHNGKYPESCYGCFVLAEVRAAIARAERRLPAKDAAPRGQR